MWTRKAMALIVIFSIYFLINAFLLTEYPAVWPDEGQYADVAYNLNREGKMYNQMDWEAAISHEKIFWYPPLIFHVYANTFKLFGFSIYSQRWTSVVTGFIFLLLFYFVSRIFLKKSWLAFIPLVFLIADTTFMKASRIGRPEIFILGFSMMAYLLIFKSKRLWFYFIAGVFASAASLIQFYGILAALIISLLTLYQEKIGGLKKLLVFWLPICLGFFIWAYSINFNFSQLFAGFVGQSSRKAMEPNYFQYLWNNPNPWYRWLNFSLLSGSVYALFYLMFSQIKKKTFFIFGLLVYWFFIFLGKQFWYYVYPIPLFYLTYIMIIEDVLSKKTKEYALIYLTGFFLIISVLLNLILNIQVIQVFKNGFFSYSLYTKSIAAEIPNHVRVFLSSIPNPYFELRKNKTLELREFLASPNQKEAYLQILNGSDYAVYTGTLDLVYGDFLDRYLKANMEKSVEINNGKDQYRGLVIKLKPRDQRVSGTN